jgi:hypothetical protein
VAHSPVNPAPKTTVGKIALSINAAPERRFVPHL